jgi:hypothetical protein
LTNRAAQLGITTQNDDPPRNGTEKSKKVHPMFKKPPIQNRAEASFEEFVPATQELQQHNLTPKSKVQAWLSDDKCASTPPNSGSKTRRRSNVSDFSRFLLNRSNASTGSKNSSNDDFEADLAKIAMAKTSKANKKEKTVQSKVDKNHDKPDQTMFSTQSSRTTEKAELKSNVDDIIDTLDEVEHNLNKVDLSSVEHIPFRPPSFQNYSSDSAKALMARYEAKGSMTPNDKYLSTSPRRSPRVRKTRSLEPPVVANDKCLDGVVAFVEVRAKHENRSDGVIEHIQALGATVTLKLSARCTHMIFKVPYSI